MIRGGFNRRLPAESADGRNWSTKETKEAKGTKWICENRLVGDAEMPSTNEDQRINEYGHAFVYFFGIC